MFLLAASFIGGQALADKKAPFEGIWQQVQFAKTDGHPMILPVWKVMRSDGTFSTFLIATRSGQSIITTEGSFKVANDSTFVENITGSLTDPQLKGKSNKLIFHFLDEDTMNVSYRMPGSTRDAHERWIRVKMERPK